MIHRNKNGAILCLNLKMLAVRLGQLRQRHAVLSICMPIACASKKINRQVISIIQHLPKDIICEEKHNILIFDVVQHF